ncbi:MAG: hypothetical protein EP332_04805 [Bacteroidetes bacterium]|nr:MAG: hypothetical protein EP332_04805 [Bacteroidota bacterium]
MAKPNIDSIELRNLLEYLQGFKTFVNSSLSFVVTQFRKRILLLLLPVLAGIGFGFWKYRQLKPVYEVEMQLTFNELHKKTYGEMTIRLQDQIKQENWPWVANVLGMKEADVEHLQSIQALNIARSPLHEDLTSEKIPFYVLANVTDPSICSSLQNGIIKYFNENPLNTERRRVNLQNIQDRLQFLSNQLAWMDSIKMSYNQQLKRGVQPEQMSSDGSIDKLFELSDNFYKEWLNLRSGLDSYKPVELIMGFNPGLLSQKPSLPNFLLRYALLGFGLSFLLLLWLAIPSKSVKE